MSWLKKLLANVCVDPYCEERGDHSSHRESQVPEKTQPKPGDRVVVQFEGIVVDPAKEYGYTGQDITKVTIRSQSGYESEVCWLGDDLKVKE